MNIPAPAFVRAIHFFALLLPAGVFAFEALVSRKVLARADPGCLILVDRGMHRLALAGAVLALASGVVWFAMTASDMSGPPLTPDVLTVVLGQTCFGKIWFVHLALITALTGVLALSGHRRGSVRCWLLSLTALVSLSFAGHAGATPHPALSVPVDAVHLITASVWPAGLVPMAFHLWKLGRAPERVPVLIAITGRFSTVSIPAVCILALSGVANAWLITGKMPSLQGDYFLLLTAKAAGLALMTAMGAVNLLILKPRLRRESAGMKTASLLFLCVLAETLTAFAILVLTGILTQTPPQ